MNKKYRAGNHGGHAEHCTPRPKFAAAQNPRMDMPNTGSNAGLDDGSSTNDTDQQPKEKHPGAPPWPVPVPAHPLPREIVIAVPGGTRRKVPTAENGMEQQKLPFTKKA